MPTTYAYVEFLPPTVTGPACQACEGRGVTGEQYHLPTGKDRVLVVDVFCPACGGRGNADHQDCGGAHVGAVDDWTAISEPFDDDFQEDRCPSCQGREWNPVQGFDTDDPDADVRVLRVPCGCTTARARTWTVAAEPQER
jgi:hypothetical protein